MVLASVGSKRHDILRGSFSPWTNLLPAAVSAPLSSAKLMPGQALLHGVINILKQCISQAGLTYDDCEQGRALLPDSAPLCPVQL